LFAIRSSIAAAFGTKAVIGGAVVAMAAGAAAGTATTGSANPVRWGQHVVEVVESCKQAVRTDKVAGSVGECVSDIAQEHGEQVRAQHSEAVEKGSPSPKPGQREGQEASPEPSGATKVPGNTAASHGHDQGTPSPSPDASHGAGHGHPAPTPRG
jgi:hypothetical protein